MAASSERAIDFEGLAQRTPIIGGVLGGLALVVIGAASLVDGSAPGFEVRLPTYVLAGAVGFVGALVTLRYAPQDCRTVLRRATAAGVLGFALVTLGTEGIIYAFVVLVPDVSLYLLSGAVVASGLAYWSYRSWHTVDDLTSPW